MQSRVNRGLTWLPTKLGTMKEMTTGTGVFWISVKTIWTIFQADDIHFFFKYSFIIQFILIIIFYDIHF